MVDIHTHLIPGVDDGAQNMSDSIAMARMAADDGITTIVATPHGIWDGQVNGGVMIRGGVKDVTRALEKAGISITVVTGAEVRMDRALPTQLSVDSSWTINGAGAYVLLEPPWGPLPEYHLSLVQELMASRITPIIAHPERSPGVQSNLAVVDRWLAAGALTQVTGASLLGRHGPQAHEIAMELLKSGRIHIIASDAHNARSRAPLLAEARDLVAEIAGSEAAHRLFVENPQRVVDGLEVDREIPPAPVDPDVGEPEPEGARSGFGSLFRRFRSR